jgi:NAD(P)-dependent dehydrogenase (short-subunit alcohol dehydrogenase family)
MAGRLAGKVALITGTGGGLGRAGAIGFAREGAKVVGCDLNTEGAEETVALVHAAGGEMVSLAPVDLSDEAAVRELIAFAVDAYGDFDILWNNAASTRFGSVEMQSIEDFDATLTHEVVILFSAVKHALDVFKRKGGGVILNTGSVAATAGSGFPGNLSGMLAHCVGKAGVVRMSQALAIELSPYNVRVNSLSPGIIQTAATSVVIGTEDAPGPLRQAFVDQLLIRRVGQPEEVVNAAIYLTSDEASYVTGSNLYMDGGWTASGGAGQPKTELLEKLMEAMAGHAG